MIYTSMIVVVVVDETEVLVMLGTVHNIIKDS